jgi:NodT family efflux transporter outer membrane factor (OMF) lipoprotein
MVACATAPSPTVEEIVPQALPDTQIRSVWSAAAEQGTVPDGWLKSFDDPQMEAVVGEALQRNLGLRGVAAQLDAAAGAARLAGAQLKPVVGLGGAGTAQTASGGTSYNVGVNASWELDIWGRLRSLREASEEAFNAAQADFDFARESLAAQTAKTWYLATEAGQQLALAKESVSIYAQLLDLVGKQLDAGRVGQQEVSLARADLRSAEERSKSAEGGYQQAVRSLEILLGRYPSAEMETAKEFVPVPPPVPAGLPSDILLRRYDIVAAERRVAAAFQGVQAARLAKLPSISLTAGGGVASNGLSELLGASPGFFDVGTNFFQPIYQGGAIEAQIEIQTAQQEQALAAYGQNVLVVFGEVETALTNEVLLAEREQFQQAVVDDNAEAVRLARRQFEVGRTALLSVLQIQNRELAARSALIRLENARLEQRINLHLVLGGSFEELPKAATREAPTDF